MSKITILVVEDEWVTARDIKTSLEKLDYEVLGILSTGEEAIQKAIELRPDLVLMDIILQGKLDGIEAAQQIQLLCNIPVVFLTAYSDRETLQRASITQPFGYLVKPFENNVLNATIQIALSRQQATVELQKALVLSEKMRKQTEADSELKSQYVSMASHEFRNSLCVIQSSLEILQIYEDICSEEQKQKYIKHIQEAANYMNRLLEDILMVEETNYGQIELNIKPINIIKFCQNITEVTKINLDEQYQLNFLTHSNGMELIAMLDERLLWHILNNLLSNAIKYSPQGGQIDLTLSVQNQQISFQVKDQGIGISAEDQKRLFKPFSRATNVGQIRGTGLGLSIVKRSVELQGGQITVESEVGQGTTFTVILPWISPKPS
jgi:signal transduction histidine kinase